MEKFKHREVKQSFPSHTGRPETQASRFPLVLLLFVRDIHPLAYTQANTAYQWTFQLIGLKELFLFHVSSLFFFFWFYYTYFEFHHKTLMLSEIIPKSMLSNVAESYIPVMLRAW